MFLFGFLFSSNKFLTWTQMQSNPDLNSEWDKSNNLLFYSRELWKRQIIRPFAICIGLDRIGSEMMKLISGLHNENYIMGRELLILNISLMI